ncbi:hypothetical protein PDESU_01946 [Pontiella desulfatans]|uniref:Uncharacterized protein n=1 Tax=Pontiella desulfatans TaxID=2750659 RepID=A0A6C2U0P3_PONDE|nr:hypothetical protein [Pontiella desulfatans]VGO13389.1 hypothetical protein PDESU_01946 [Pontiella desulfatans]
MNAPPTTICIDHNSVHFTRARFLMETRSCDPNRAILNLLCVERRARGISITATNGQFLRSDNFNIRAEPGVYCVASNTVDQIGLIRVYETAAYPNYRHAIPRLNSSNSHVLEGHGLNFVVWAAAALGTYISPTLIHIGENEPFKLHIHKKDYLGVVLKNRNTTAVIMPVTSKEKWTDLVTNIQRGVHLKALLGEQTASLKLIHNNQTGAAK